MSEPVKKSAWEANEERQRIETAMQEGNARRRKSLIKWGAIAAVVIVIMIIVDATGIIDGSIDAARWTTLIVGIAVVGVVGFLAFKIMPR